MRNEVIAIRPSEYVQLPDHYDLRIGDRNTVHVTTLDVDDLRRLQDEVDRVLMERSRS